jgi:hypothetical protein
LLYSFGNLDGSRKSLSVPEACCNAQAASLKRLQIALPALREIELIVGDRLLGDNMAWGPYGSCWEPIASLPRHADRIERRFMALLPNHSGLS